MVASSDPHWLQWACNALVSLFERMGLKTNVGKTVSMVCRPCPAAGNQSEAAYERNMTGEGPTYWERQKERFECGECGKEMVAGLLSSHRMTQHGKAKEEQWICNASAMGGEPRTYRIDLLTKGGPRVCPVEGCSERSGTRTAMRMHFCSRHVRDIMIILEEGNLPHPRCSQCDMLDTEMHTHCRPCPSPSWAALHRATPQPSLGGENYPICL